MASIEKIAESVETIKTEFEKHQYICSDQIATAVYLDFKRSADARKDSISASVSAGASQYLIQMRPEKNQPDFLVPTMYISKRRLIHI